MGRKTGKPIHWRFVDITGLRYGRLVVLDYAGTRGVRQQHWLCLCDCGMKKTIAASRLKNGSTVSCGCRMREAGRENAKHLIPQAVVHGMSDTPTYNVWKAMKSRCSNPNIPAYEYYGARGIRVCSRWEKFENFLEDMGVRPDGLTLERVDNDGNYEPATCKWVTQREQLKNRRKRGPDGVLHARA